MTLGNMLYYIHGYESSPQSSKAILFKKMLHATPIVYREGKPENLIISDCLQRIFRYIHNDKNAILIGSSLGGFLAAKTALDDSHVSKLFLLNPAIIPPDMNFNTKTNVPKRILKDMYEPRFFYEKIRADIIIIRGTNDTVVPHHWISEFAMAQEATFVFLNDDHRFTKTLPRLPQIIFSYLH